MGRVDVLAGQAYAEFGTVDVLVDSAGTSPSAPSSAETSEELFDKVVGFGFKGPVRPCARVGQPIDVSALRSGPHIGPYLASEAALTTPDESFAEEFDPRTLGDRLGMAGASRGAGVFLLRPVAGDVGQGRTGRDRRRRS